MKDLFSGMSQLPGESIDKYITRLKQKAQYCNFTDENEKIRDQVIEKCASQRLRRKLLERDDVKLDDVIKLAQTMAFADK
jgi:gamma-glutamyl:cysteine ligase YbdK (ATP-grasp superfamily)